MELISMDAYFLYLEGMAKVTPVRRGTWAGGQGRAEKTLKCEGIFENAFTL